MIGFLRGILEAKSPGSVLIDAEGVGYHIMMPASSYSDLPAPGAEVKVYTHLYVRENALELYGFLSIEDRALFLQLITVTDVGPKTAMGVMSGIGAEAFREAVAHQDVEALTRVPGVGKKTAERLILELKDKIGDAVLVKKGSGTSLNGQHEDAMAALVALGYSWPAVRDAMRKSQTALGKDMTEQEVIKQVLRYL